MGAREMLPDCGPIPELSILNRHPSLLEGPELLHELVQTTSSTTGTAIDFLEDGSKRRRFSYRSLHALSDALAAKITRALARLENASAVIPVLLPQSPELYISLLAVLKAGKAFCPLGLDTPVERLCFILNDISADLLITDSLRHRSVPASVDIQVLHVDHELSTQNNSSKGIPPHITTNNLAYVLYTSGSTGLPKAVSVSHRAVTQSLLAHDRHIPDFVRFLQFAAPTFDVSIFEIFFTWYRGHTLVGCTRAEMLNDLPRTIAALEVDAAELTPTVASNLLQGRDSVPGLKLLLTIGEMLTRHVIEEFGGNSSRNSILWGMYGPTETAIHCTLQPSFSSNSSIGCIGTPLDTVLALVVAAPSDGVSSTSIKVLPSGEVGELVIGGPQVAEEYLNRPELTACSFIQHPEYGYLYRTGDKARLLSDGTLECLGRIASGQVKLRGQRVELGEIEQVITKVDGCHTATVMILKDRLIAFCAVGSRSISPKEVSATCKRWLPTYMVPTDFQFVQKMPQLPSGKVDKKALEAQYLDSLRQNDSANVHTSDEHSLSILRIVQQHLAQDVSLISNLASAGLDSLRSIQIASALRKEGYKLGAVDILSNNDLNELIETCKRVRVDSSIRRSSTDSNIALSLNDFPGLEGHRPEIASIYPCTPLQEGMLAETMSVPSAYCNWIEVELAASLDFPRIQKLLKTLALENEVLRSGFFASSLSLCSFAQVIWKRLDKSQIQEVSGFSRSYSLGSSDSLLRPLNIQVNLNYGNPKLLFQIHHALYDGWSFDLLLRDLHALINGIDRIARPSYYEVLRYHVQARSETECTPHIRYWGSLLHDCSPALLPNFNGCIVHNNKLCSLRGKSSVSAHFLLKQANELSINPQVFFQVASSYVLGLYIGSTDVVMGVVTSGRTIPVTGIEEIIGPCIASLPSRLDFSDCTTVKDMLEKTQNLNRDMLRHCTLPLQEISKLCSLRPGTRLFDVLFVWQQSHVSDDNGSLVARITDSADELEYKITLEFEPRDSSILYRVTYDPSTIPDNQVKHLSRQIDEVVHHLLNNVDGRTDGISTCFSTQSTAIANPSPQQGPILHGPSYAVERWAFESPDKEALILGEIIDGIMRIKNVMTYDQLNKRANRYAHVLAEHNVRPNQLVCVLMEKSIDLYVSILAVLKLGSGYLPIVPDTPIERTRKILAEAQIKLCISQSSASGGLQQGSLTILNIDEMDFSRYSDQNLNLPYNGSDLAYAVFTSGSTGTPKGVLVTQDNLMSNLDFLSRLYPTSSGSRILQSCSQAFDVSVFEIFFAWYVGICLCTATKDDLFFDFEASINNLDITHLSLTPTVAAMVDPIHVPKVKFLVTAGEAVTEHVRRQWAGKGLYQGYGPSETTNICTVRASVSPEDLINNIGPPFSNTSAFVLDPRSDKILPRGAIGELCFGGSQVFRGYLNRQELNAQKIIDHPMYGRIYRSGDMGILLPDDCILFMGRFDDQVKIRGQRVELGEINSVVLDHSAVQDCTTLLFQSANAILRLVTFWVPEAASTEEFIPLNPEHFKSSARYIFESLSLQLPSYMVPTHLVPISRIPMTPQSKVDRRLLLSAFDNLPEQYLEIASSSCGSDDDQESFSTLERMAIKVLARTLDIPPSDIRRTSSFFNLGLDSVSAIRFSIGLRESGFGNVPVSTILKQSTVERLCSSSIAVQSTPNRPHDGVDEVLVSIFPLEQVAHIRSEFAERGMQVQKVLPCTPLQEAMLSSTPASSNTSYCNTMVFDIVGDIARLKTCWSLMINRHQIFRTAFISTENPQYAFAQVVLQEYHMRWDCIEPHMDINVYAQKEIPGLLQTYQPPIRLATDENGASKKLIFCCHHALYDGTAISNLLNEIQHAYWNITLPPPVPYERYLEHMVLQDLNDADQFWMSCLASFEPSYFPELTGKTRAESTSTSSFTRTLEIPLSEVISACQEFSISLLSMVQATWIKLLQFYQGENDLCFGNVVSGRTLPSKDLDRLVAPCFNTLPVRLSFDFEKPNIELVKRLHDFNIDSMPFQLTPLRRIQNATLKGNGRLFDTLVILQQPSIELDGSIWSIEHDVGGMDLPIVCEVFQSKSKDRLEVVLHYDTGLLSDYGAKVVTATFESALRSLVQFPQAPARDTVDFPAQLRAESNTNFTSLSAPGGQLLHSAMERNAKLEPERTALEFLCKSGDISSWSFKTLNEKANQVASALLKQNVKPEDIIPIHIPKSPQFYVSMLGILKAGGAFAPIHPDLPVARKQFMLSELRPKVLLCIDESPLDWCESTRVLNVDTLENHSRDNPVIPGLSQANLAYCLYTSGSTGTPKAVSMEHRSPIQTVESSRQLIPWIPNSRLLQYASITFDMCYYDCFLAWTFGFTLCTAEQDIMLNDLTNTINTLGVDLLDLTPSVALSLNRSKVPTVKWLYCIGEAMSPEIVKHWEGKCVNSYGPTEAAFCTTIFPVQRNVKTSLIGSPFPTTSFAVFPHGGDRPVPVLGVGELYIGGVQLARGYHGQHDLTKEKFVHKCGQRFYKTGDIVRMLNDGNFEFIGRADDQVKIRGLRVELGEISHVLQDGCENIASTTTQILKKTVEAKEQLVAFLVPRQPIHENEQLELRRALKQVATEHLPAYMIPHFFIFLDKIPRSMAGKVDKKALEKIFRQSEDIGRMLDGNDKNWSNHEWTNTQSSIRGIFATLSNTPLEEVFPTTSIYQLGLDSISAVQIAATLRQQGFEVNAADVMRCMNCVDLAASLDNFSRPSTSSQKFFDFKVFESQHKLDILKTCGIKNEQVEAICPCTPLQKGMVSQFLAKDGAVYFNYLRLQIEPGVDMVQLKKAWFLVMRRHRMLRTGFAHITDSGNPFAMIHFAETALGLPWDFCPKGEPSDTVNEWLRKLERNTIQQLHLPPWRIRDLEENQNTYLDLALLHAIFDAQSLRSILNDVAATYNGKTIKSTTPLNQVLGTILHLSDTGDAKRNEFWARLGQGATPTRFPNLAPLRYDPAPPIMLTKYSSQSMANLEIGCRKANITLQAAAIASWSTLLSAYTGESIVTCGVVLSGRNFEATESAVFPCITTVPFVFKNSDDKKEVLKEVMALNAEIQRHQFTPLQEIQKLMGYPNEPLFDTIFAFQKLSNDVDGHDPWMIVDERATIEYPISIELKPKGGRLEYRLMVLPHIVPKEQAALILDQLDHLMCYYIVSEACLPNDLPKHQTLYSITPPREPFLESEARLLHELVENTALKYPNSVAFEFATSIRGGVYTSETWTYNELDDEGNKVANILISRGIQPGGLVGVCFDKCPEASFAILGILKAGCAFVAVDPGAPPARQAFIIKDSAAHVILSMKAQSAPFKDTIQAEVLNLDEVDLRTIPTFKPSLKRVVGPQDRSYCLYTSGTTGTPKGCELTHENAVQALASFQRLFAGHWNETSRWLQFASFHFDVSVLEQYWSWSVGIRVISAPRDLIFEDIAVAISTLGITHIDLTPSLAQILHPDDVPSLCKGVFITGGESLKQEILDVWGPKGVIYNGYGPTEATIGVTMYPRVPANGRPSNIGPQFDNVGSLVLRPGTDIPVLRGGTGELCVSGKLVGKGYLNRADLTEERFPYLPRFNEKVYRTGDLVRILHDGSFDFLGRADDQVKLRGQRLEIGEINSVIKQSRSEISDIATLVLKHPKQQKEQLVSFVVIGSKTRDKPRVLLEKMSELQSAKEACQEKLPAYMVPTHFVALTAMPLSANNKADARKLKSTYEALSVNDLQQLSAVSGGKEEKLSRQEERLRSILSAVFEVGRDAITKDANFFELGMDSISVIGVARALKQAGLTQISASIIMKNSTIRRLAKALSSLEISSNDRSSIIAAQQSLIAIQHRHRRAVAEALFLDPREIESLAPCTPLQQGMIARSLDSERGLYFNTFHLKLIQMVDEVKLKASWEKVYMSTQILRTVFANSEDGYVQAVLRRSPLPWKSTDVSSEQELGDCLASLRKGWLQHNRTDLRKPFEVNLVTTPERKILIVHIFHALYDGNSIRLVVKSVWEAYNDRLYGNTSPAFHTALAHGPLRSVDGAKDFWQINLANASFNSTPALIEKANDAPTTVVRRVQDLGHFESTRRKLNVTAQAIAQACWVSTLQTYVRGSVTIGMVVSGRSINLDGADQTIGPLFNTIPYYDRPLHRNSWASMIKKAHEFNMAAHPYQHTPLRDIIKWCKRSTNQPLFDNLFVYQVTEEDEEWAKNGVWELVDVGSEADYPLAIEIEQSVNGKLKLTLVTQSHISNEVTSNKLLDRFENALREALDDPEKIRHISSTEDVNEAVTSTIDVDRTKPTVDGAANFEWNGKAIAIRDEISNLAAIEASEVNGMTSIFELGLDSIDAIKLSSKLKKRGVDLPVSGIMRGLTIANMVQHISSNKRGLSRRPSSMIFKSHKKKLEQYLQRHGPTEHIVRILPLTPLQEAMVAEMISSNYMRYYNHDVLKVARGTDVERLRQAWTRVVEDSPILRTSFIEIDDPNIEFSFAQIVHRGAHAFWSSQKLDEDPDFPTILENIRQNATQLPRPNVPFHVHLIEAPNQTFIILSIAHALYDGWSLGLLHSDVYRAYMGLFTPRSSYESTLCEIVTTCGPDAEVFWRDYLSDSTLCAFPRRLNLAVHNFQAVYRQERGSNVQLDSLSAFARKHNITFQTLGQTVYALVLASYVQSLDVVFGSVLSGRDDDKLAQLLFPTMNTVAVRTIIHGTRQEMLQYVQNNFSNIKQWQHFPLRRAIALAGIQGSLFQSLFIYQKSLDGGRAKDKKLYYSVQGQSEVEYPVCVEMEIVGGELKWRCALKVDVFDELGGQQLLNRLDEVLEAVMEAPDAPTIEFTGSGTSICGLPAFMDYSSSISDTASFETAREHLDTESLTTTAIREVLAFVSKTPGDEITKGMTLFHIGLDSISAIKVSSLLRKRSILLSVGDMLRAGTIERMAQIVDERTTVLCDDDDNTQITLQDEVENLHHAAMLTEADIDEENIEQILPATAGQLYMLSMWLNSNGELFYPEFSYQVQHSITFEELEKGWELLVGNNSILRTYFVATKDQHTPYAQAVLRKSIHAVVDITDMTKDQILDAIEEHTSKQPYAHLFVSKLVSGWALKLKIHHALYDGVSLPLLVQQLQAFYNGVDVPPVPNTLSKFIASASSSSTLEGRKSFWTSYLSGVEQRLLPQLHSVPRSRVEIFEPSLLHINIPINAMARKHGVSVQSIFLAIVARIYASRTSTGAEKDVVIGMYLANRSLSIPNIDEATIPTVNLLPLRVSAPQETGILDISAQIQYDIQEISSLANASANLFEINEWTGVKVDAFVNFLKLPTTEKDQQSSNNREITISRTEPWTDQVSRVTKLESGRFEAPKELVNEPVTATYLYAIDIEATVRDGALDVGVFAPAEMMSLEDGEKLIADIKAELESLGDLDT